MPALSPEEFAALREDIRQHGQLVPILIDEDGVIIDGHNRNAICLELGLKPKYEVLSDLSEQDKWNTALRLNNNRRQLTPEQKRELIRTELHRDRERTDRQIASLLGVDARTVANQRHLLFDPPDPVIPDPKRLPTWGPAPGGHTPHALWQLDEITDDYPAEAFNLHSGEERVEHYEQYVLWCGERLVAFYQTVEREHHLGEKFWLIPLMTLKNWALQLYETEVFDWDKFPQAATIWARLNRLLDEGFAAQNARIDLLSKAEQEAELHDPELEATWDQQKWNVWNWRQYYLTVLREGPLPEPEEAA
jgi:hypothetical protein